MQVFSWLQVNHGTASAPEMVAVPVHYGLKDRVAASVIANQTQNTALRLPSIAVYLRAFDLARDKLKGYGIDHVSRDMPRGGVFPDDMKARITTAPIPLNLTFSVNIMTTNLDEKFQILEQVLLLFRNYQIQLHTSDKPHVINRLVSVDLESIANETAYPSNTDRRMIIHDLTFKALVYIAAPVDITDQLVHTIKLRLATLDALDLPAADVASDIEGYGFDGVDLFHIAKSGEAQ
jgi:hypothetical protein